MRENSPSFPFKKRFLLPLVHSWYFTLSLGPRAPGWGWSQGGPPSGGPCAVLGGGEGTSMEEVGVWLCLNHSELYCPVCLFPHRCPVRVLGKRSPSQCLK